jgi:hypothetical protein
MSFAHDSKRAMPHARTGADGRRAFCEPAFPSCRLMNPAGQDNRRAGASNATEPSRVARREPVKRLATSRLDGRVAGNGRATAKRWLGSAYAPEPAVSTSPIACASPAASGRTWKRTSASSAFRAVRGSRSRYDRRAKFRLSRLQLQPRNSARSFGSRRWFKF